MSFEDSVKTKHAMVGDVVLNLASDYHGGKRLDTKVTVEKGLVCWIEGKNVELFISELQQVVNKYRT